MEDTATGDIRLSILWNGCTSTLGLPRTMRRPAPKPATSSRRRSSRSCWPRSTRSQKASNRDLHGNSKKTTLLIAREIVETYVSDSGKLPWYIDLLNITLGVSDLAEGKRRIQLLRGTFRDKGARITENLDFEVAS